MQFFNHFICQFQKLLYICIVIDLHRHIEILLLANDCVIVPDFGGFITHSVQANYSESDKVFLPPMRTLGFNPQLRMNDSVLAQSYVEAYDISYPEALRRIESEVAELRKQLDEEGHYTLEDLGELTVNEEGNYEFSPCESGILSPDLYALVSFPFKHLKDNVEEETFLAQPVAQQEAEVIALRESEKPQELVTEEPQLLEFMDNDDDNNTISIKMSWVRNAVAIAAAIAAFFFIATPVTNSDLGTEAMTQLQNSILYKLIPQDTTMPAVEPVVEKTAVAKTDNEAEASLTAETTKVQKAETETTKAETAAHKTTGTTYCIIVASHVKLDNAERYVEKLKKSGFPDAYVYTSNNVVRVVSAEFDNQADAYQQLNKMNTSEEFYEAWVYKRVES